MEYGVREPLPLKQLGQATVTKYHTKHSMLCSADEAQLMRLLIQLIKAKKVIEIGVYTGYNTLSMAMTLPTDGKVVACDVTDEFMKDVQSEQYFKEAGVESKIDLRLQSAITTLDELLAAGEAESFDLVFIDADKPSYDQYYEKSLRLIRKGGLIVIDNVLWSSRVCDPEKRISDENTKALHNLNMKVHKDTRVVISMMPFADGVTIAMKL
ncbi:Catechol O-methyltransferase domain-containing protein 1 [Desmophyllum pertusum]|uniref:Catechol O-methyltransferase domain-containing protein 1 n=1 Tax=Desmophyllum pertusum TaxID=174260 RepID=A0A9X0DAX6_9CNID|nr:Catechol O-methyltransferase domain-containing protein 1 [Desmophyllum pertusum]